MACVSESTEVFANVGGGNGWGRGRWGGGNGQGRGGTYITIRQTCKTHGEDYTPLEDAPIPFLHLSGHRGSSGGQRRQAPTNGNASMFKTRKEYSLCAVSLVHTDQGRREDNSLGGTPRERRHCGTCATGIHHTQLLPGVMWGRCTRWTPCKDWCTSMRSRGWTPQKSSTGVSFWAQETKFQQVK